MDTEFMVVFQTIYRAEFQQTLFVGAVVRKSMYDDRTLATKLFADDFSSLRRRCFAPRPERSSASFGLPLPDSGELSAAAAPPPVSPTLSSPLRTLAPLSVWTV